MQTHRSEYAPPCVCASRRVRARTRVGGLVDARVDQSTIGKGLFVFTHIFGQLPLRSPAPAAPWEFFLSLAFFLVYRVRFRSFGAAVPTLSPFLTTPQS